MGDLISRQAAVDALIEFDKKLRKINWYQYPYTEHECRGVDEAIVKIANLPSAQPTLYGYSIDHLALIAHVMEKEGVSPEEAVRFFKDTQRICQMLVDEIQKQVEGMFESCVT